MLFISRIKTPVRNGSGTTRSGRHAVVGGRHEKWGTHNALLYTKNAYIEWLSVEKMEIAATSGSSADKVIATRP